MSTGALAAPDAIAALMADEQSGGVRRIVPFQRSRTPLSVDRVGWEKVGSYILPPQGDPSFIGGVGPRLALYGPSVRAPFPRCSRGPDEGYVRSTPRHRRSPDETGAYRPMTVILRAAPWLGGMVELMIKAS